MALIFNCDMGESFGLYHIGDDVSMMPLIDVANVACGFHASDYNHMRSTVQLAKKHGVSDQTLYAWKKRFGRLDVEDTKRLKGLESENARLKKLLAERDLEIEVMKEIAAKKW